MKKNKILYSTLICTLLMLIPTLASAEAKFVEGSIDINDTKLYLRATEDSPVVCQLEEGARVGVYDEEGDFVRIIFGNYRGYIKRDMLFVPSEDVYEATVYSSGLRVRVSPGTYSTVITQVDEDTPVTIVDVYGDWYKIEVAADDCDSNEDVTGFVAKEYICVTQDGANTMILRPEMSGSRVKTLQKELKSRGFLSASATGYYGNATKQAVADFQLAASLSPDGIAGEHTLELLYGDNDIKAVVQASSSGSSSSGGGSSSSGSGRTSGASISTGYGGGQIRFYTTSNTTAALALVGPVHKSNWDSVNAKWPAGKTATITVVATGAQFNVYRGNKTLHADVTPVSAADVATMKSTYGGSWSWARCPIWVTIDGTTYAASMNGMPHEKDYVPSSGFGGHFCVHFYGSKGHGTGAVDKDHQAAISFAYNAANG